MDAEELTDEQIAVLREALVELISTLETSLADSAEGAKPVDLDEPIGRLSRMTAMQQQAMASANRRSTEIRLQQARAALARIDRDEFGLCAECEEPIGIRRLTVKPESRLCVRCQSARDAR